MSVAANLARIGALLLGLATLSVQAAPPSFEELLVEEGDEVEAGDVVAVIEAMKMECPLESPAAGTVAALWMAEKQPIEPGAPLLALRPHA